MSQIKKYQEGNTISNINSDDPIITINGLRFLNSSGISYLENSRRRNHYSRMYKMDSPELNKLFNQAVDKYVEGLRNGEIEFYNGGLRRKDGQPVEGIDPETDFEVLTYFIDGLKSSLIPLYNESYKPVYSLTDKNLTKVLSKHQFGTPDLTDFMTAWNALDAPNQETGLRSTSERKKAYVNALRSEANRLRTDAKYRSYFKFPGWQNNIKAYEDTAAKLENHANSIESLDTVDFKDESWKTSAILAGIKPNELEKFFSIDTDKSREIELARKEKERERQQLEEKERQENLKKTTENFDPLSTKDAVWWEEGTPYTLNDSWQSLTNLNAIAQALSLLYLYNRQQIKKHWSYWNRYAGKYLENLTTLFPNLPEGFKVYSVSKGVLGNSGKEFFIRTPDLAYPVKVNIAQGADGSYYANSKDKSYNLGAYDINGYASAARVLDDTEDKGLPEIFERSNVFQSIQTVNDYWNNTLLKYNPKTLPVGIFWDMLYKLSNLYYTLGPEYRNGNKLYKGSAFYRSNNTFVWSFRGNSLRFIFKGPINYTQLNGKTVMDPSNLVKVEIGPTQHKLGGKIRSMASGDVLAYQEKYGLSNDVEITSLNKNTPNETQIPIDPVLEGLKENEANTKKSNNPLTYGGKSDDVFTGADAVRMGASILDLLGSFMIFPKGLNIASAAVTGTAFLGYLGADMYDVIDGKADFGPTLFNDLQMLGVMAFPMFVNPAKVKAWGAGEKLTKLAGLVSKWWGTAVTTGLLLNKDTRDSIAGTIKKTFSGKFTELDAHDFSNWAFILRSIGGTKELASSIKSGRTNRKAQKEARQGEVKYNIKKKGPNGEDIVTSDVLPVTPQTDLRRQAILEQILKKENKGKLNEKGEPIVVEGEEPAEIIKAEQIEITTPTKTFSKKSDPKLDVKFRKPNDYTDLETEAWYPTRIWQRATKNGETVSRENTAFGKWMRDILKDEEFDVPFSDYEIIKGSRLNKINKLSKNLFGGINLLKELGKSLEDLRKLAIDLNWSQEKLNGALLTKMDEYGFGIPNSELSILTKANELADYYAGTLSKLNGQNDLDFAIRLYGLDKPSEDGTSGIKLNDQTVTLEDLTAAYNKLNNIVNSGETTSVPEAVMNNFNKESIVSLYKLNAESLAKLLKDTKAYKSWENKGQGKLPSLKVITDMIEEISKKYNFDKTQTLQLKRLLSKDNFISKRHRDTFNKEFFGELKPLNITELALTIKEFDDFKNWKKKHSKAKELSGDIHKKIYNYIKENYNYSHKDMQEIGYLLNGSKDEGRFVNLLLGVELYKVGGSLDFVGRVIKMANGNQVKRNRYVGGVQLSNPDNPYLDDWYTNFYSPSLDEILDDIGNYATDKDYAYLFNPEDEDSIYNLMKIHSNLSSTYNNEYLKHNASYVSDDSYNYSNWLKTYFPAIITSSGNTARANGRYSRNGTVIYDPIVDNISNYKGTNLFASGGNDSIPLVTTSRASREQFIDFYHKLKERLGDNIEIYLSPDGYMIPVTKGLLVGEGYLLLSDDIIGSLYGETSINELTPEVSTTGEGSSDQTATGSGEYQEGEVGTQVVEPVEEGSNPWDSAEIGITEVPTENLAWLKALYTLAMNAGNWDIRNTYKPVRYRLIPNIKSPYRVRGDLSDILTTNKLYGSALSRYKDTSSDQRINLASQLKLNSDYANTMLTANKTYRDAWNTSADKAREVAETTKENLTTVANANALSEYKEIKEQLEIEAATKKANLNNWKDYFEKMFAERELLNDYRRSKFIDLERQRLLSDKATRDATLNKSYWEKFLNYYNLLELDMPVGINESNFMDSKEFIYNSGLYDLYKTERETIEQEYLASYRDLINETYSWQGLSGNGGKYGYYRGPYRGNSAQEVYDREIRTAKQTGETTVKRKQGGTITMARQGGASINWVKVENARMANKNINTIIKETYRNIREANNELLKNIRAMEPLIRLLLKRDIAKQK